MNKRKSWVLCLVAILIIAVVCTACTTGETNTKDEETKTEATATEDQTKSTEEASSEPLGLTWWHPLISANQNESNDDILCYQKIQENTNVDIEWIHPTAGSDAEQFNIMLASGDYPDIITNNWTKVDGGVVKALNNGVIIELNDLMDNYAPNYLELAKGNKGTTLDDGTRLGFHPIIIDKRQSAFKGFQIRQDWLDTLGMEAPTTIDEWYDVLTAMKNTDLNKNGEQDEIPFGDDKSIGLKNFATAWGVYSDFYVHATSGEVEYGPIQPEYKEFLTTMAQWYAEGLIDPEFSAIDGKVFEGKVTGNQTGSYISMTSRLQRFPVVGKEFDENYALSPVAWPVGPAGKEYSAHDSLVNTVTNQIISITSTNEYPEETTKFLDYIYSEEGIDLINWGVEGVTYTEENGEKKFTDLILNDPELPPSSATGKYCHPTLGFNAPLSFVAQEQVQLPVQIQSNELWGNADTSLLIPILTLTSEESAREAEVMPEIKTYQEQMMLKFIMGLKSLDEFDEYVAQIEKMGIEDIVQIKRDAYARYQAR